MNRLVLTADQIYALAYFMKAKYLDYYYISLSNRDDNNKLWLGEVAKQLVSQGTLVEDFSGNTTIDSEVEALVKPIYFGTKESSLDINIFGDEEENQGYRFHYLGDKITMTKPGEEGIELLDVSTADIQKLIDSILPDGYSAESGRADIEIDAEKVSRVFIAKNTEVKVKNVVATFVETNGVVYEEDKDDIVYSVSESDLKEKLYKILAEV